MSAYDDANPFAEILRGERSCDAVFENTYALAFRDIRPQAPTHILAIPKGRYVSLDDFAWNACSAEIGAFLAAVRSVGRAPELAGGYRVIVNTGPDARQTVPHFHMHILGGRDLGPKLLPGLSAP